MSSKRRDLILVSCLDDNNIHCHIGNRKCIIKCDNSNVGLAIRKDKLYLLSNWDHMNRLKASSTVNVYDVSSKHK
jgi:hypothetical protein